MATNPYSQGMPPFDTSDTATVSARWKKWKRSFEIFLDVNNVALASRKKSYLLHFAGNQVQDVYFGLRGDADPAVPVGSDIYKETIKILDNYFLPMKCLPLERHKFRNLAQSAEESIEKFVLRLREQGNLCEYDDHLDDEIKEQIFEKGISDELRAKILTKPNMSLAETVDLGRSLETIEKHKASGATGDSEVNKITSFTGSKRECYRCGRFGHYANDEGCPAKKGKCDLCGLTGHFKKRCKTKSRDSRTQQKDHRLRQVNTEGSVMNSDYSENSFEEADGEDNVQYLFAAEPDCGEKVTCAVGGVKIEWIVDSGAGVNVIDRKTWDI